MARLEGAHCLYPGAPTFSARGSPTTCHRTPPISSTHAPPFTHQYYFSPPGAVHPAPASGASASEDDSDAVSGEDEEADGRGVRSRPSSDAVQQAQRPSKRVKNNRCTLARIDSYPQLKSKLEAYKARNDDVRILRVLRLLRYVEESEEGLGGEAAVEALVLEMKEGLGGV